MFSTFALCFYGVPFHLMVWSKIWIFLTSNVLFIPYIGLYIIYTLVCEVGILGKKKKKKTETETVKADSSTETERQESK